ncbi:MULTISPECIES: hypothetical protein [unclassified Pedobacter]|uniref:hypothetical protein n=1 Tax=unclassified Pedobacter TaxID=2628915 RepID=UPI00141E3CCA|nr:MULTISPECIES: hypothetical protein [unclassified Pedobacter]NII83862.1 hypothetical protein [Pedobacter sp. SG908]NMN37712.1 hypothetical protein [Pedobacter sp. SG918]
MKTICFVLIFFLSCTLLKAQGVKPYIAIIKTEKAKYKGILQRVDSVKVVLNHDGTLIPVLLKEIKTVQIRAVKKDFKGINLIKVGDEDPDEYHTDERGKSVDKFGHEAPDLKDYAAITFYSVIFTAVGNALALPIHAINPNVARFKFNNEGAKPINELSYYSIYYQANPNVLAELQQLKSISSSFKP